MKNDKMKKNKIYAILIALSIVSFLFSCVEDKGSEITLDINEIKISGIELQYDRTSYFDTLRITPTIECSLENFSEDNSRILHRVPLRKKRQKAVVKDIA